MNDKAKKKIIGVQVQARSWGDPGALPADARAALNPAPQPTGPNEKTIIVPARFDLARNKND